MKTEKKLYRVDVDLSYLVYTDEDYTSGNIYDWMKNHFHSGELDDASEISIVTDSKTIEDDFDLSYIPYCDDADDSSKEMSLEEIIDLLGLDAKKMIKRLEKLGYKVTKK
jgi:uncharacterized protein YgfB (UPF0149 family)